VAERRGAVLALRPVLTGGAAEAEIREAPWFERALDVPGQVVVPEAGVTLAATLVPSGAAVSAGTDGVATVQAGAVTWPFTVRNRRPGDRMRPLGAPGSRKLQDVFVDRKVPRRDRDRVPLVVDAAGRIIWVAGLAIAHECRVTAPEAGVVVLELRR
jgi:tRNA(Ile)-lysidine synthetase-like protein